METRTHGAQIAPNTKGVSLAAIAIADVAKIFDAAAVLRHITVEVPPGSIAVLLGENGAGKSTLLRLIAGLTTPSRGSIRVFGQDPRQNHAGSVRRRMAYVSHASMLYDELSVQENLRYFASLHRVETVSCACSASPEMALRAVGLDHTLTRPVSQFSQGMRQRAALACALQSDPDLLLLDEPFSNLDVAGVEQMLDLLRDFRTWPSRVAATMQRTVLLTTHQAALALPIADIVLTLKNGVLASESGGVFPQQREMV